MKTRSMRKQLNNNNIMRLALQFGFSTRNGRTKAFAVNSYCDMCIKFEDEFTEKYGVNVRGYANLLKNAGLLPTTLLELLTDNSKTNNQFIAGVSRILLFIDEMPYITPENFKERVMNCVREGDKVLASLT